MDRNVITEQEAIERNTTFGGGGQVDPDRYLGRLVKYIPAEVVGAHVALQSLGEQINGSPQPTAVGIGLFLFVAIFAPVYLRTVGGISKVEQILVSEIAFIAWAAALKGPPFDISSPAWRMVVIIATAFALPALKIETVRSLLDLLNRLVGHRRSTLSDTEQPPKPPTAPS